MWITLISHQEFDSRSFIKMFFIFILHFSVSSRPQSMIGWLHSFPLKWVQCKSKDSISNATSTPDPFITRTLYSLVHSDQHQSSTLSVFHSLRNTKRLSSNFVAGKKKWPYFRMNARNAIAVIIVRIPGKKKHLSCFVEEKKQKLALLNNKTATDPSNQNKSTSCEF